VCALEASRDYEAAFKEYESLAATCGDEGWETIKVLGEGMSGRVRLRRTPCGMRVAIKGPLRVSQCHACVAVHEAASLNTAAEPVGLLLQLLLMMTMMLLLVGWLVGWLVFVCATDATQSRHPTATPSARFQCSRRTSRWTVLSSST
jgi:hypothetical protein